MSKLNISEKQKEILLLLYRFRFLDRIHIQKLLKHKTHQRTNYWLKDLTEKQYIGKIFKRSWTENTFPTKYYIRLNGIRFLKTQPQCHHEYLKKLYKENKRSQTFINRCLFIAQVYLLFLSWKGNNQSYEFYTQSDYKPNSLIRQLRPDFVIVQKKKNFYIYQIFYGNTPRYAIRNKIRQYQEFFEYEGKDLEAHVTYICPKKTYIYTQKYIEKFLEENDVEFSIEVTTRGNILHEGLGIKKRKREK